MSRQRERVGVRDAHGRLLAGRDRHKVGARCCSGCLVAARARNALARMRPADDPVRFAARLGVIVLSFGRSVCVMRRWIAVGGVCALLGLSACGQAGSAATSSGAGGQPVVAVRTTAVSDPQATYPGGVVIGGSSSALSVRPEVIPRAAGPQARFSVRLTARVQLGVRGVLRTEYRVSAVGRSAPGCVGGAAMTIDHGAAGARLAAVFAPGRAGWCRGEYRGVVSLESGPNCSTGSRGAQSRSCPRFASRLVEVGRFAWQVR